MNVALTYHAVKFLAENENENYDIIHRNWLLDEHYCLWPDKEDQKSIVRFRSNGIKKETWKCFEINILSSNDNLLMLRTQLNKFISGRGDISAFESDSSSSLLQKRKIIKKKLFTFDEINSSSKRHKMTQEHDDSDDSLSPVIRKEVGKLPEFVFPLRNITNQDQFTDTTFPKVVRTTTIESKNMDEPLPLYSPLSNRPITENRRECSLVTSTKNKNTPRCYPEELQASQNICNYSPYLNENFPPTQEESSLNSTLTVNVALDDNVDVIPLNEGTSSSIFSLPVNKSPQKVLRALNTQNNLIEKVLLEFQYLKSKMNKMEAEIGEIRTFFCAKDEITLNPDVMSHLPVKNNEDFYFIEEMLKVTSERNSLLKWLSIKCGSTSDGIVLNIMNNLIIEAFSLCCNWTGVNSKIGIKNSWMIQLITGVLIKKRIILTEKEVSSNVKKFLRHAWDNAFHRNQRIAQSSRVNVNPNLQPQSNRNKVTVEAQRDCNYVTSEAQRVSNHATVEAQRGHVIIDSLDLD